MHKKIKKAKQISNTISGLKSNTGKKSYSTRESSKHCHSKLKSKAYNPHITKSVTHKVFFQGLKNKLAHNYNYIFSTNFSNYQNEMKCYSKEIKGMNGNPEKFSRELHSLAYHNYHLLMDDSRLNFATVSTRGFNKLFEESINLPVSSWKRLLKEKFSAKLIIPSYRSTKKSKKHFVKFYNSLKIENQKNLRKALAQRAHKNIKDFRLYLSLFDLHKGEYDSLLLKCSKQMLRNNNVELCIVNEHQAEKFIEFINSLSKINKLEILYSKHFRKSNHSNSDILWVNKAINKDDFSIKDFLSCVKKIHHSPVSLSHVKTLLSQPATIKKINMMLKSISLPLVASYKETLKCFYSNKFEGDFLMAIFSKSDVFRSIITQAQTKSEYECNNKKANPLAYNIIDEEDEHISKAKVNGTILKLSQLSDRRIVSIQSKDQGRVGQTVPLSHDIIVNIGENIKKGDIISRSRAEYRVQSGFSLKPPTFEEILVVAKSMQDKGMNRSAIETYCFALNYKNNDYELISQVVNTALRHTEAKDIYLTLSDLIQTFYQDFLDNLTASPNACQILYQCFTLEKSRRELINKIDPDKYHSSIRFNKLLMNCLVAESNKRVNVDIKRDSDINYLQKSWALNEEWIMENFTKGDINNNLHYLISCFKSQIILSSYNESVLYTIDNKLNKIPLSNFALSKFFGTKTLTKPLST